MKILNWLLALALTLAVILAVIFAFYCENQAHKQITCLTIEVNGLKSQIEASALKIDKITKADDSLIEEIKKLTQEKLWQEQENQDLRTQIEEFGWWKGGER